MWLVGHNRCWTADRLAESWPSLSLPSLWPGRWDYKSPSGRLCFCTRFLVWPVAEGWHAKDLTPDRSNILWGWNSIVILGAWTLWNHRNRSAFDGVSPNLNRVLTLASDELRLWGTAGAKGYILPDWPADCFCRSGVVVNCSLGCWLLCNHAQQRWLMVVLYSTTSRGWVSLSGVLCWHHVWLPFLVHKCSFRLNWKAELLPLFKKELSPGD
jgi:hypothetical protein